MPTCLACLLTVMPTQYATYCDAYLLTAYYYSPPMGKARLNTDESRSASAAPKRDSNLVGKVGVSVSGRVSVSGSGSGRVRVRARLRLRLKVRGRVRVRVRVGGARRTGRSGSPHRMKRRSCTPT